MDERDFETAQLFEQMSREAAVIRARTAKRFVPVEIHGASCCADCLEPLEKHRIGAGICVPCLSRREHEERLRG